MTGMDASSTMTAMTKVLVVDDSGVARLGMSRILASLGCEVTEAQDGAQALLALEHQSPQLVFLDLLMPALDGLGVLAALQARGNKVPVVVLSADIQESTLEKCRELGAFQCLAKPPTRAAVEAVLGSIG